MAPAHAKRLVALMLLLAALGAWWSGALQPEDVLHLMRSGGGAAPLLFAALYVLATVTLFPASVLTLAAGYVWGPVQGLLTVWPAAVVGAQLAFWIGRFVARDAVHRRLESLPSFDQLEAGLKDDAASINFWLRLSPVIPFNVLNYTMGVSPISSARYALTTAVGILPGTAMYVYLGSSIDNVQSLLDGTVQPTPASQLMFWAGLAVTIGLTVWLTRRARRVLATPTPGVS